MRRHSSQNLFNLSLISGLLLLSVSCHGVDKSNRSTTASDDDIASESSQTTSPVAIAGTKLVTLENAAILIQRLESGKLRQILAQIGVATQLPNGRIQVEAGKISDDFVVDYELPFPAGCVPDRQAGTLRCTLPAGSKGFQIRASIASRSKGTSRKLEANASAITSLKLSGTAPAVVKITGIHFPLTLKLAQINGVTCTELVRKSDLEINCNWPAQNSLRSVRLEFSEGVLVEYRDSAIPNAAAPSNGGGTGDLYFSADLNLGTAGMRLVIFRKPHNGPFEKYSDLTASHFGSQVKSGTMYLGKANADGSPVVHYAVTKGAKLLYSQSLLSNFREENLSTWVNIGDLSSTTDFSEVQMLVEGETKIITLSSLASSGSTPANLDFTSTLVSSSGAMRWVHTSPNGSDEIPPGWSSQAGFFFNHLGQVSALGSGNGVPFTSFVAGSYNLQRLTWGSQFMAMFAADGTGTNCVMALDPLIAFSALRLSPQYARYAAIYRCPSSGIVSSNATLDGRGIGGSPNFMARGELSQSAFLYDYAVNDAFTKACVAGMASGQPFISCHNPETGVHLKTYHPDKGMSDKVKVAFDQDDTLHVIFTDEMAPTNPTLQHAMINDSTPTIFQSTNLIDEFGGGVSVVKITSPLFVAKP